MKKLNFVYLTVLFLSCGEARQPANADPGSTADTEVLDTLPHAEEKWYGKDSENDTVIYESDGKILTKGIIQGTFYRIERDDFMYYVIADSNGLLHRFFLNTEDQRQMDKFFDGYEPARGHPVTVEWIRGQLALGKDGGMVTMYQAKKIVE